MTRLFALTPWGCGALTCWVSPPWRTGRQEEEAHAFRRPAGDSGVGQRPSGPGMGVCQGKFGPSLSQVAKDTALQLDEGELARALGPC